MNRSPAPFTATVVTAVLGVGLLVIAMSADWLGPDVGRGAQFCEAARDWFFKQPANSLSNLGFVVAGVAIGWQASRSLAHGRGVLPQLAGVATGYGCVVVLLGPASAAMHATQSDLGGHLDMLSMYLVASFAAACALARWWRWSSGRFWALFAVFVVGCEVVARTWTGAVPVVEFSGNVAFATLLITAAVVEVLVWRRDRATSLLWGLAAIGSMATAFTLWNLAKDRWCDPHSLVQGHAGWHLLCALAAWCLFQLYASDRSVTAMEAGRPADAQPNCR